MLKANIKSSNNFIILAFRRLRQRPHTHTHTHTHTQTHGGKRIQFKSQARIAELPVKLTWTILSSETYKDV